MSYAERRDGKLTGWWYGEAEVKQGATEHRFRKRFKTKGEAEGYEAYVRATGQEPAGMSETPVGSFKEIAARFRASNPTWGTKDPSAIQRLEWITDQLGRLDIKAVTTAELDKLVDKLRRTGLSNRTINRYLDAGAKVLGYAFERSMIPAVPHVPRLANEGNDRTEVLSDDMEDACCRWIEAQFPANGHAYAFVVRVLAETGFRRGELWKLEPEQIGNKTITLRAEQTKTQSTRTVPVPADMATKLRAMIAARTLPKYPQVWRVFKAAAKACGGSAELTIHSLRHTRGTRLIEAGVDVLTTARLLGHSNIQTTKRYVHQSEDTLAEAAEKVHQRRGDREQKGTVVAFEALRKPA